MHNPFDKPLINFDVNKLLKSEPHIVETNFKNFFFKKVQEELSQLSNNYTHKLYKIIRYIPTLNSNDKEYHEDIVVIQAITKSHAAYLFLLHETRYKDSFTFTEMIDSAKDLGPITPIDLYIYSVQQLFNKDNHLNDYLKEINSISIIK